MKLLIIIVEYDDSERLMLEMNANGIKCTKLASSGGFLKHGNTTFLIGVDNSEVDNVLKILENVCKRRKEWITTSTCIDTVNGIYNSQVVEVEAGGANIFIVNLLGKDN